MYKINQRVVCVNDAWGCDPNFPDFIIPNLPQLKKTYSVRDRRMAKHIITLDGGFDICMEYEFLLLNEIVNPIGPAGVEPWFNAAFFAPVLEKKTSIEVFETLLIKEPTKILEKAHCAGVPCLTKRGRYER